MRIAFTATQRNATHHPAEEGNAAWSSLGKDARLLVAAEALVLVLMLLVLVLVLVLALMRDIPHALASLLSFANPYMSSRKKQVRVV
jgi:hypothetical protein